MISLMFFWHWASSFIWRPNTQQECLVLSLKSGEGEGDCSNFVSARNNKKHLQTYRFLSSITSKKRKISLIFIWHWASSFIWRPNTQQNCLVLSLKSEEGEGDCSNIVSAQNNEKHLQMYCFLSSITSMKRFSQINLLLTGRATF